MKTAGELLKEKRLTRELTIEAVAAKIKVKPEYLIALENSDFQKLPSATFTKGFLKNYAVALRTNPETVLAMFRRDFEESEQGEIVPRGLVNPIGDKKKLPSANIFLIGIAILSFIGFLGYQLIGWWSLPRLNVIQPQNNEVYGEKVTVKGKTQPDNVISIGGQKVIVSPDGDFSLDLLFPAGSHSIIISATNRQNKMRMVERNFTVSK
jgi:cytoskeletal protein RodZ